MTDESCTESESEPLFRADLQPDDVGCEGCCGPSQYEAGREGRGLLARPCRERCQGQPRCRAFRRLIAEYKARGSDRRERRCPERHPPASVIASIG